MNSPTFLRSITKPLLVVCCLVALLVLLWFLLGTNQQEQLEENVEAVKIAVEPSTISNYDFNNQSLSNASKDSAQYSLADALTQVCPDLQSDLSVECKLALDEIFWDKPLGDYSEFVSVPNPLTYRRIFTDPPSDRALVVEALQHRECRLQEGDLRLDLKESCHGEAFAKFASFMKFCDSKENRGYEIEWFKQHPNHDGKSRFQLEMDHIEQYREIEPDGYFGMRNSIWSDVLESRWLHDKCLHYDMSQLRIRPESKEFSQLELISLGLVHVQALEPATTLSMMAARFGVGWSFGVEVLVGPVGLGSRDSYGKYLYEHHPWIPKLNEALVPYYGRDQRLRASIEVIKSLQDIGWELNLDKLVIGVCGNETYSRVYEHSALKLPPSESCSEALEQLNAEIPQSDFRELKILEEFERLALKHGVYDAVRE